MRPRPPQVFNRRHKDAPPEAVYVGRPTKWGNPFRVKRGIDPEMDHETAVRAYREWLFAQPLLVAAVLKELAGKDLVCWCAPLPCHADVLLRLANDPANRKGG